MIAEMEIKLLAQVGDGTPTQVGVITVPVTASTEDGHVTLNVREYFPEALRYAASLIESEPDEC